MDKFLFKRGNQAKLPQLQTGEPFLSKDEERLYIGGNNGNIPLPNKQDMDEVTTQLAQTEQQFLDVKSMRNVLDYGVKNDGTDTEDDLNALEGGYTYVFPSGTYAVRGFANDWYAGFKPKDNTKYIFLPGAKIKVLTNNSRIYAGIYINGVKNFEFVNPVVEGDRLTHDFSLGGTQEFGHGIMLEGSAVGVLDNPHILDVTGDGIDILCTTGSDLQIIYPKLSNSRRNGISIESVDKLLIDVPKIDGTNGISPEAGIDIEPWADTAVMNDVVIRQPTVVNSGKVGLSISSLDRCIEGYNIRIDKPIIDGLQFGHGMTSLNGEITIDNPIIRGGKIGITNQSKPNARIINPIIEIDPNKIDYATIPSPIYFYDGSSSGGEVGEVTIENVDLRNTGTELYPVYFGDAGSFKNIKVTFARNDINRPVNPGNAVNFENVNVGMLPYPIYHSPNGIYAGNGVFSKIKLTNKGATGNANFDLTDSYHLNKLFEAEFEVVTATKLNIRATGRIIYPFGTATVNSTTIGSRIKLKYDLDQNGVGAFYATEIIGTWTGV